MEDVGKERERRRKRESYKEESLNDLGIRATLGANYRPTANYQVEAPIYRGERLPESSENRPGG